MEQCITLIDYYWELLVDVKVYFFYYYLLKKNFKNLTNIFVCFSFTVYGEAQLHSEFSFGESARQELLRRQQQQHSSNDDNNSKHIALLTRLTSSGGRGLLNGKRLRQSLVHLPLDRCVDKSSLTTAAPCAAVCGNSRYAARHDGATPCQASPLWHSDMTQHRSADVYNVYDPAFLLPLIHHAVVGDKGSALDSSTFERSGLLAYCIVALTSLSEATRRCAARILGYVRADLGSCSSFAARPQLHMLLESVRLARAEPLSRLSPLLAAFVVAALPVMRQPSSTLYPSLNRFLLSRPALPSDDVPMFYELLQGDNSTRQFLLHYIADGLRTADDLLVLQRRAVIPIIMAMVNRFPHNTHFYIYFVLINHSFFFFF